MKRKSTTSGAHGLRTALMSARNHLDSAVDALDSARKHAVELGACDQLALAVKALRGIANAGDGARTSALKGIAAATLKRMEVEPYA